MFRLIQNFQGMFKRNYVFHQRKSKIFIATSDVIVSCRSLLVILLTEPKDVPILEQFSIANCVSVIYLLG